MQIQDRDKKNDSRPIQEQRFPARSKILLVLASNELNCLLGQPRQEHKAARRH
ncbi:hypothetical protein ARMGADRAFT_1012800 [Armillaria gallica]|uniref:Uncharacterized protein n=1 Tax=Armillaria gallica TaxID=47427 RepID=A0A2H3E091_ARMGA|nr:hypothetical protein ARMGADRAFT_1012800 [Armillaria gallica]